MNGTPDSGYYQNGVNFDGVDDHGEVYTDALSTPHESFTIETAFDVGEISANSMSLYWTTYSDHDYLQLIIGRDGEIFVIGTSNGGLVTVSLANIEHGLLHVVIISDGNGWKIYVNGNMAGNMENYMSLITSRFYLANPDGSDDSQCYKTTFYTFRIYQRALTEEEINQNYEAVKASIEME